MTPIASEWVLRAEADWSSMDDLTRIGTANHDLVCFLAQQCAEKYIKAVFQQRDIPIPHIHNLPRLAAIIADMRDLSAMHRDLKQLSMYAVAARYPGPRTDASQAQAPMRIADRVRSICRRALGLDEPAV